MGLAASQCRLLFLTSRKSDIEYQQMQIANQKIAMSRESAKVSEDYSNKLNAKKLVMANSSGSGTTDITYNLFNNYSNSANSVSGQYLLADATGRIVLSDDDAAVINGLLGTSGSSGEAFVLTDELKAAYLQKTMGITESDATSYVTHATTDSSATTAEEKSYSIEDVLKQVSCTVVAGSSSGKSWKDLYDGKTAEAQYIDLYAGNLECAEGNFQKELSNFVAKLKASKLLNSDALTTAYSKTVEAFQANYYGAGNDTSIERSTHAVRTADDFNAIISAKKKTNTFGVNAKNLINSFFTYYEAALHSSDSSYSEDGLNALSVTRVPQTSHTATKIEAGTTTTTTAATTPSQNEANFYLNKLNAIANSGWVDLSYANDADGLQTAIKNGAVNIVKANSDGSWGQVTTSDSSSGLQEVDDTSAQTQAEATYKADSAKINEKESELDIKEKNLETERSELDTEIDSVKSIINKNVERSYKFFQA
ncbi:hypothetical protein KBA27_05535 [bacterium]|nr:hypothetical protein [bacterium]